MGHPKRRCSGKIAVAMIIAVLSDIHSNLEALRACLAHAREQGVLRHAFLGDLVGYGADPAAVIEVVAEHASRGDLVVKGNHDEAILGTTTYLNDAAAEAIEWTREVLGLAHVRFLASLPYSVTEGPACFVHASAASPKRWDYVDSPAAALKSVIAARVPYTFCGHVHEQALYHQGLNGGMIAFRPRPGAVIPVSSRRRWLALVGSVGQPRDNNPAAAYAIADLAAGRVTFHRIPYDHMAAARKVREAGLSEAIAFRIERGI
jgi:diadenosine tetraphosphatase ApaH/serine/threonine PP2A family protein phosphatase